MFSTSFTRYSPSSIVPWSPARALRRLGIVDDLSKRMALNVLYQTGILKSVLMSCEDELGFRIMQERFYRMNTYARAIDTIKREYEITLTPTRYTVKPLDSYFD